VAYHQSVDLSDPTLSDANAALGWSVTAGRSGRSSTRIRIDQATDLTPGGAAQEMVAEPYYPRRLVLRRRNRARTRGRKSPALGRRACDAADGTPRKCWRTSDGLPQGSDHFYQARSARTGCICCSRSTPTTHARRCPSTRFVSSWQMVMLPGSATAVPASATAQLREALVAVVLPYR